MKRLRSLLLLIPILLCAQGQEDFYLRATKDPLFYHEFRQDPYFLEEIEPANEKCVFELAKYIIWNAPELIPQIRSTDEQTSKTNPKLFNIPILGKHSYTTLRDVFLLHIIKLYFPEITRTSLAFLEWGGKYGNFSQSVGPYLEAKKYCFVEEKNACRLAKKFTQMPPLMDFHTPDTLPDVPFDFFLSFDATDETLLEAFPHAKKCPNGLVIAKPHHIQHFANGIKQMGYTALLRKDLPLCILVWHSQGE